MSARITPPLVWIWGLATLVSAACQRTGVELGYWKQLYNPNTPFALCMVLAYAVSFRLCLKIAGDHKNSPAMRWAWILFACSAAFSIVRHLLQALVASLLVPGFHGAAAYVPTQLPMALSLVLLFAGLLCMWRAYSALHLDFHAKPVDLVAMTLMLLMLPPILISNLQRMPGFVAGWMVMLPFGGAILLPACGGVAVLLHRIAMQMRGGETARALLFLIWFPGVRLVAMLGSVDPFLRSIPLVSVATYAIYQTAPLIFTLALAYRWQIAVKAAAALNADSLAWNELYPIQAPVA